MISIPLLRRAFLLTSVMAVGRVGAAEMMPAVPPSVPGYPIGRCVLTQNISSPEDAHKAGFDYLEVNMPEMLPQSDEEFAKTVTRLRGIGIKLLSAYGFMPADLPLVGPAVDQVKVDAQLRRGLDRAKALGVSMVVHGNLISGARSVPKGFSTVEGHKQFADFCRRAAKEGAARGITVLIMPMGPSATNQINTVAEGLALVEEVNSPNLKLMVDFTTMIEAKENFAILRKAGKSIAQIEIQNPKGRIYPVSLDEADYTGFFRELKAGGYRGGFSVHGKPGEFWVNAPKTLTLLRTLAATELADKTVKAAR